MDNALGSFLVYLKRKGLANRTIGQHRRRLKTLLSCCVPWSENNFNNFIAEKLEIITPAAVNKYLQTAKHYCEFTQSPFSDESLRLMSAESKVRVTFSDAEIEAFLALPPNLNESVGTNLKWKVFWSLLAYSGARPGEIVLLTADCVDLAAGALIFPKTKTHVGRTVKISPLVYQLLAEYVNNLDSNYLFPSQFNKLKHMSDAAYLNDFHQRLGRLGIKKPVVPYSFRHSFATRLLDNDALLFSVQDILGHSNPNTTRIYYHGNLKSQEKAIKHDPMVKHSASGRELLNEIISQIHRDKECYSDKLKFDISENDKSIRLTIALK